MDLKSIFGKNVKYFRYQKNYTQATLAEKVNVSTKYIGKIETGKNSVDFDKISNIANALDVKPYQLFLKPKAEKLPRRIDMIKK